ncbi:MAG: amino acid adenylation domain-containing protein, partial [Gammaproteobacteria bacterium]|nr:amino acid adenylation domain-containing protein [Gammaproteobacteria bacterium]
RRSFEYLMSRHESLRTSFRENNEGIAQQTVHDSLPLRMTVEDISSQPDSQKKTLLEQAKTRMTGTRFNLDQAPLSRILLIHYDDKEWVLIMVMHHIIGDGWSMGILSRELAEIYHAYSADSRPELPPIHINYRDYSVWQRRQQQYSLIEQGVKRWCQLLENSEFYLDLNTGKPKPELRRYQGSTCPLKITPMLTRQLQRLAESKGVSLFVLLLTAYFVLLQRYSGRNDLLVGTQVANRHQTELEPIVGFFINTIPLRAQIEGNSRLSELLEQVNNFCLSGFDLQYVPFDRLVEAIKPERDFGSNPLVQIIFLWQNAPISEMALKGLAMQREPLQSEAAKFDLSLELGMEQGQIQGVFEYSTDLYDAQMMTTMVSHYTRLLQGIVDDPDSALSELRLSETANDCLTATDHTQLSNDNQQTIVSAFNDQVDKTPNANALNDGQQVLSYQQLSEQSQVIANRLQLSGVEPGAIVAIYLPRANDYLVAILGILQSGCCYLPLEMFLPKARIELMLADANVAAIVSYQSEFEGYRHIQCNDYQQSPAQLAENIISPQSPAYLIYTSGSTGQPKGVAISHQSVLGLVQSLNDEIYQHNPEQLNVALMASFIFDASVQQIFGALLQGHCLHICDSESRRDGKALLAWLQQHDIQLSDCTPSLLQIMLDAGLAEAHHLRLRQLIVGGEALPPRLVEIIANSRQSANLEIYNVYGPTECSVDATIHAVDYRRQYQGAAVSIGHCLAHAQLIIVDGFGNQQPDGLAGEIYISGNALAHGYWQKPALTAERFVPAEHGQRYYRTGDQGRVNQHGEIGFLGRLDDQVKVRGYRIELGEIEVQLAQCPGVLQAVARINTVDTVELVAYLVLQYEISITTLRDSLAKHLPDYMIPAHFVVLDTLPLNPAGKIDRKALPTLSDTQRLRDDLGGAAKGDQEQRLAQVWCDVLGLESIGRDDNYFASGGDSIKALQIVSRLRKQGWKLEVRDLFTHATIRKLAPRLTVLNEELRLTTERSQGEVAISPIQQH